MNSILQGDQLGHTPELCDYENDDSGKKYQFVNRSGSTPKFWIFKARSPRMNVGFFNRYHEMLR